MRTLAGLARLSVMASLLMLGACGGSGGSNGSDGGSPGGPPPVSPPSGLSYPSSSELTVGQQIVTLTPTVTGTVSTYAVSPELPDGLLLDASTGAISGTPKAPKPLATYTVTASSPSGYSTADIALVVKDIAPGIAYESAAMTFTTGLVATVMPSSTGGPVVNWSISPALPTGLVFGESDGSIRGTPTAVSAPAVYEVTAQNSGGQDTFDMSISVESVESSVLLDLGHAETIKLIRYTPSRVLSQDTSGHWVLWDAQTNSSLANGDATCQLDCTPSADLVGTTVAIRTSSGFDLHSAANGELISRIATSADWWALAADGSYICAGNGTGLRAWSAAGDLLVSRPGNYQMARVFAAANEIRVGGGPVGANVLERISIADGSSSASPAFAGTFHSWFLDGARFLTNVGTTIRVYTQAVVQEDIRALTRIDNLGGRGDWFWTYGGPYQLNIYAVGNSASAAATYSFGPTDAVVVSGNTIGASRSGGLISIIDLSGASPVKLDATVPFAYPGSYAAISSSQWLVANRHGVLLDGASLSGTPEYFGYGAALSIAGSAQRIAVATASGTILYFDAETNTEEGRIHFPSSKILLSTDGAVLAAAANAIDHQYFTDRTLKIFSMPAATEIASWPYSYPNYPIPFDISLSGSGQVFGKVLGNWTGVWQTNREATTVTGSPLWSDQLSGDPEEKSIRLSPDGASIAVPNAGLSSTTTTNIYKDGVLVGAALGWPAGWLDDNRLLVNRYQTTSSSSSFRYIGAVIVDGTGQQLSSLPALPHIKELQVLSPDIVYSPEQNAIVSLITSETLWTSANPSTKKGTVAGGRVVFGLGAFVRTVPVP